MNRLCPLALDRESVLSRVINAPRELVSLHGLIRAIFPVVRPGRVKIDTKSIDIRVGGEWRFDMTALDGKRYTNRGNSGASRGRT